jgi:8-oxo-dGTP diphosphatase
MGTEAYIERIAFLHIKDRKALVAYDRADDKWFIVGGSPIKQESAIQTLIREVREELSVFIKRSTIKLYGEFVAPAHKKPGVFVRMACYTAEFTGAPQASSEVRAIRYIGYDTKSLLPPAGQLAFEDLYKKGLIA